MNEYTDEELDDVTKASQEIIEVLKKYNCYILGDYEVWQGMYGDASMITDEWHIESHKKYLRDNKGENHAYK
jgi:hypothetical protein